MPLETKKVLWTVFSVGVVLIVFFGLALLLFYPRKGLAQAPASVGNASPARVDEPEEYLREPPPPVQETPPAQPSPVIIYGDKPDPASVPPTVSPGTGAAPGTQPSTTTTAPSAPGAARPKPIQPKPAASAPATTKPAVAARPRKVMVDEYWIQASSFASRERAEGLKASLAEKGLASVITVKDVDGKSYFRVRIGPYSKKGEADGWLSRIKAFDGCDEAFVSKTTVERTI